ncbi:MAG: signal peptidase II [Chloroflexi bacterium]|nr:signal peptidase II [Chloroflexota bacterium]
MSSLLLFGIAALTLALDQLTKRWVMANLVPNQSLFEDAPVRITYVTNTGAAFGLFQGSSYMFALIALAVVVLIVLYFQVLATNSAFFRIALGLQLGGAVGNLIDRVRYGHVVDFVDLRFWPVFNVADSAIVVGVILLGYLMLFGPSPTQPLSAPRTDEPAGS